MGRIGFGDTIRMILGIIERCSEVAAKEPSFAAALQEVQANLRESLGNIQAFRDTEKTLAPLARAVNRAAGTLTPALIADGHREEAKDTHLPRSGIRELYDSMVSLAATILGVELPNQRPLMTARARY